MSSSTGRRNDPGWNYFIKIKPSEKNKSTMAKCKKCNVIMSGLIKRMKTHYQKCGENNIDIPETESSTNSEDETRQGM